MLLGDEGETRRVWNDWPVVQRNLWRQVVMGFHLSRVTLCSVLGRFMFCDGKGTLTWSQTETRE